MTPAQPSPQPATHIDYLDGWRGLAILLVLQSHFLPVKAWDSGALGVDLFFVLSGWLMAGMLFIKRQPLPIFFKRRISRIVPGFFTFVLLVYAMTAWCGAWPGIGDLLASLLFLRTYLPAGAHIWGSAVPIGHLWSLNAEEHSYLYMALLVLLPFARRREHWALLLTGLAGLVVAYVYARAGRQAPPWGRLGTEVAAAPLMLSAGYRLLRERHPGASAGWITPVATLLAALCYVKGAHWSARTFAAPLLLAVAMNHLAQAGPWLQRALSTPWLRQCGLYSFSLYLWQQVFYVSRGAMPFGPFGALALVALAGWCSYRLVELPARRYLNERW